MSRRREVEAHLITLGEIREIMAAMKNLSFMETRKLSRFIDAQQQSVQTIEDAAADFLHAHPGLLPPVQHDSVLVVVLGSERGFCGDYNEVLLGSLEEYCHRLTCQPKLFVIGSKLADVLEADDRVIRSMAGAAVAEEVPSVLQQVVDTVDVLENQHEIARMAVMHHDRHGVSLTSLLPPFQDLPPPPSSLSGVPFLYLEPERFLAELTDHYLFAALHALFYTALLTEHQQRIQHLEGALRRLDDECQQLKVKRNGLRQEEITEEIEQILLSAGALEQESL